MLSLAFLVRTVVRPDVELARHAMREMEGTHWPTPAALLALLVGYALLLTALGYALATTIFFWLTAWLLGSEKPARDAVIGRPARRGRRLRVLALAQRAAAGRAVGGVSAAVLVLAANLLDGFGNVLTPRTSCWRRSASRSGRSSACCPASGRR